MEMYELKNSSIGNSEWKALFVAEEENKIGLLEAMNNNKPYESKELIKMLYKNIHANPSEAKEIAFSHDMVRWSDDITYGANEPEMGVYMIVAQLCENVSSR